MGAGPQSGRGEWSKPDSMTPARPTTVATPTAPASILHSAIQPPPRADAERLLMDAAARSLRLPKGKLAIVLHLSRMAPPVLRPHHGPVARALMEDAAQRSGGHVFPLRSRDLVLLCDGLAADGRRDTSADLVTGLSRALARLFEADAAGTPLVSVWRLDEHPGLFLNYVTTQQPEHAQSLSQHDVPDAPVSLRVLLAAVAEIDLRLLLAQITAVRLRPGRGLPVAARLVPLYRALLFQPPVPSSETAYPADPLGGHTLAQAQDERIVAYLLQDLRAGGPLTRPMIALNMPVHVRLSPAGVISPGFARFARMAADRACGVAVEWHVADVQSDPELSSFARGLLSQAGCDLVLGGIDHAALTMTGLQPLQPSLVKLGWSPKLPTLPPGHIAAIDRAIGAIGQARIVLVNADGEAALAWGQERGVTRFEGPYMDAVQAASRIAICHSARACSLRQCTTRAGSLNPILRGGCGNPGLLDMTPFFPEPAL